MSGSNLHHRRRHLRLCALLLACVTLLVGPAHLSADQQHHSVAEANRGNLTTRAYIDGLITAEAQAHGIDPAVLRGVVRVESGYRIDHIGAYGEIGLCQLMIPTAKETCRRIGVPYSQDALYDPEYNLSLGAAYLRWCLDRSGGNYREALERYNGFGPGYARRVLGF